MGSFFARDLIQAYPDAQVILVERDIEQWYASLEDAVIGTTWGWRADLFINILAPLFGGKAGLTMRKVLLGFFGARNVAELRAQARGRYRKHYADIRAAVPPERLLDFQLEEGWAPICAFLGKEVPAVPFPRNNPREAHVKRVKERQRMFVTMVARVGLQKALPWIFGISAVAVATALVKRPGVVRCVLNRSRHIILEAQKQVKMLVSR